MFSLEGNQRLGQRMNMYFKLWVLDDNYKEFIDKKAIRFSTCSHDTSNAGNYSIKSCSNSSLSKSKINTSMSRLF